MFVLKNNTIEYKKTHMNLITFKYTFKQEFFNYCFKFQMFIFFNLILIN